MGVMPAKSEVQQRAAGAALTAKRGETAPGELYGAAKQMYKNMSGTQLGHFAGTKHKGLPHKKALTGMNTQGTTNSVGSPLPKACMSMEDAGRAIVDTLLGEDNLIVEDDEQAEIASARNILAAISRLQASLKQASPEQQHDITTIRAAANSLVRMHGIV
jgi:hypothetical protein